jgi:pimeloyl-ACP methyl ester carboxylesterase
MAAKLQAINASVPPYPFSVLVPPPLSQQLYYWRAFLNQTVSDLIVECAGTPQNASQSYIRDSPTGNANISIPVITIHGTSDALVPYTQSLKYQAAVAAAGRSDLYRLYLVPGGQHVPDPLIIAQLIPRLLELNAWANTLEGWTLVTNARALKAYPDLKEYIYQKNATMPPNGQYDKIGLHRLVKDDIITKGAVFIDPGIYGSGEQLISNPPENNYTADESSSQAIYWANRGFEVYSIDWRTHFLPSTMNVSQASAIVGNWGWDIYINDMKEAVDKAKDLSGNSKIFLAGISMGGQVAMYYASEYWKQDVKGLIILDGTENPLKTTNTTNTYNVTVSLNALAKIGGLAWETPRRSSTDIPPSGMLFAYQTALQNPGAPAEWPPGTPLQPTINPLTNKTWANITDYIAYQMYSTNYSNIYEGYGNISVIVDWRANGDRYYPVRLGVETLAIHDWNNCPYVSFDFDDHYKEIDVPIFAVRSGLWGIPTYGNFTNGTANSDFTQITLPKYGHLDVFTGPYSAKDVSEPTYQWMVNHLPAYPSAFGNTNVGSYQDGNDANAKSASYFMCSYTGTVTDIFAYVASAGDAGVGGAAVYADNGGSPGALVAATDKVTVGSAFSWVDFHLALPVSVNSGTGYWLAVSGDNGLNMKIVVGSGVRAHNGVSSWFSDPFGFVWGSDDTGAMSIYAKGTTK